MSELVRIFKLNPFEIGIEKPFKLGTYSIEYTRYNSNPVFTYKEDYDNYTSESFKIDRATFPSVQKDFFKCKGTIKTWKLEKKTHYQESIRQYLTGDSVAGLYLLEVEFEDQNSYDSYELPEYYQHLLIKEITDSYQTVISSFVVSSPMQIPNEEDFYTKVETDDLLNQIKAYDMVGATEDTDGVHGLVPVPLAGDQDKYLKGDGTWSTIKGGISQDDVIIKSDTIPEDSTVNPGIYYIYTGITNDKYTNGYIYAPVQEMHNEVICDREGVTIPYDFVMMLSAQLGATDFSKGVISFTELEGTLTAVFSFLDDNDNPIGEQVPAPASILPEVGIIIDNPTSGDVVTYTTLSEVIYSYKQLNTQPSSGIKVFKTSETERVQISNYTLTIPVVDSLTKDGVYIIELLRNVGIPKQRFTLDVIEKDSYVYQRLTYLEISRQIKNISNVFCLTRILFKGIVEDPWIGFRLSDTDIDYDPNSNDAQSGRAVWQAVSTKQDKLPEGTTGYYLRKTANGVEWAEVQGGSSNTPTIIRKRYSDATDNHTTIASGLDLSSATLVKVYKNGLLLEQDTNESGSSEENDYLISSNSIVFNSPLLEADKVIIEVFQ